MKYLFFALLAILFTGSSNAQSYGRFDACTPLDRAQLNQWDCVNVEGLARILVGDEVDDHIVYFFADGTIMTETFCERPAFDRRLGEFVPNMQTTTFWIHEGNAAMKQCNGMIVEITRAIYIDSLLNILSPAADVPSPQVKAFLIMLTAENNRDR